MKSQQKSILIIDDEPRNIFALRMVLRSRGYQTLSAADATAGLQMMRAHDDIGIVLLDMMMPGVDGYQALREIRMDGQIGHIPVIAVTAQAMKGDREKCLQAGATGYISKPVDVEQLTSFLKQYL